MNVLTREFPDFCPQLAPEATLEQVPRPTRRIYMPHVGMPQVMMQRYIMSHFVSRDGVTLVAVSVCTTDCLAFARWTASFR